MAAAAAEGGRGTEAGAGAEAAGLQGMMVGKGTERAAGSWGNGGGSVEADVGMCVVWERGRGV